MSSEMTNEEKKRITNERQKAVRQAWKLEKERVQNGKGTRDWSKKEQAEIAKRGSVAGYEGHHMKSVSLYPEQAGNPKNIQFLNEKEHLQAHGGDYHKPTNGYYDPKTQKMHEFKGSELREVPAKKLSSSNANTTGKNTSNKSEKSAKGNFKDSLKTQNKSNDKGTHNKSNQKSNQNKQTI